jgi:hypothetical protein
MDQRVSKPVAPESSSAAACFPKLRAISNIDGGDEDGLEPFLLVGGQLVAAKVGEEALLDVARPKVPSVRFEELQRSLDGSRFASVESVGGGVITARHRERFSPLLLRRWRHGVRSFHADRSARIRIAAVGRLTAEGRCVGFQPS